MPRRSRRFLVCLGALAGCAGGAVLLRSAQSPHAAKERLRAAGASRASLAVVAVVAAVAADSSKSEELLTALREPERQRDAWSGLGELRAAAHDWARARDAYDRARRLDHLLGDLRDEALASNEIGHCAEKSEKPAAAGESYRQALALWERLREPDEEARTLVNLGYVTINLGNAGDAISYFDRALALGSRPAIRVLALSGRGKARAFAGDWKPAFKDFRDALALVTPGDPAQRAKTLLEMANAYLEEKVPAVALARYGEALSLLSSQGDRYSEAVALNGIGVARYRIGDDRGALAAYGEALSAFHALGSRRGEAAALVNIGWLQGALSRPAAALDSYRRALPVLQELQDRAAEAAVRFGMAWVERREGNPRAAQRDVEAAIEIVETLRDNAAHRNLQASYLATRQDVYGFLVDLLMDQHRGNPLGGHDAEALAVSERAKGRSLLDSLSAGGGPGILLTAKEIERQVLDDRTLLLEYHLGREQSFLWVLSPSGLASFELRPRAEIEAAAGRAFQALQASGKRRQRAAARRAVVELGRLLLGPVARALEDKLLLIVPDGILHDIPFAALPDLSGDDENGIPEASPEPLVLRHEIVSIASASVLAALRARPRPNPPSGLLAAVADPVTVPDDPRLARSNPGGPATSFSPAAFPRLSGADAEAGAIVGLAGGAAGGDVLDVRGFAADRDLVLSGALARYRFVHFVTHGSFDPLHLQPSGLVLSLYDRAGRTKNGVLYPGDLAGLRWSADLVTLSACETARGRDLAGEGLVGFTQGFLAAGAARVLVSLWPVPDRPTALLMERFYQGLLHDGLSPAAALRRAQISMWREPRFRAPYSWAGFFLQGEPR